MPTTDGQNLYYNVKELPQAYNISSGDFLLVENSTGTNIIDFSNFVITLDNTTFGTTITTNTTNIAALSSTVSSLSTSITTSNTKAIFSIAGASASISLISSYNIVTNPAPSIAGGSFDLYFSTPFQNANYLVTTHIEDPNMDSRVVILSSWPSGIRLAVKKLSTLTAYTSAARASIQIQQF